MRMVSLKLSVEQSWLLLFTFPQTMFFAEPPLFRHLCSNDNCAPLASLPAGKEW